MSGCGSISKVVSSSGQEPITTRLYSEIDIFASNVLFDQGLSKLQFYYNNCQEITELAISALELFSTEDIRPSFQGMVSTTTSEGSVRQVLPFSALDSNNCNAVFAGLLNEIKYQHPLSTMIIRHSIQSPVYSWLSTIVGVVGILDPVNFNREVGTITISGQVKHRDCGLRSPQFTLWNTNVGVIGTIRDTGIFGSSTRTKRSSDVIESYESSIAL